MPNQIYNKHTNVISHLHLALDCDECPNLITCSIFKLKIFESPTQETQLKIKLKTGMKRLDVEATVTIAGYIHRREFYL